MKTMKNHTFRVFLVLLAILLSVLAAGCTGGEPDTKPVTYDPIVNDSVQIAKDKDTLISLLKHDGEFTVEIAEDIYLDSPVAVYGTKRLTGDKSIIMELDTEQYQHMLEVRKGATLIVDGATIDGNGAGTCVKVTEDASMLMLSGLVTYGCPYGVEVLGKIDIQGGTISETFSTAVYIRANASGSMTAGQIIDNCCHGVKVEKAGYMSISKDAVLSNSSYSLVHNSGTCDITGGSLTDGGAYIAYNMGDLNVTYTGSDPEGKLEWQGASVHAISQGKTGNLKINGLSVRDTGWHGISSTPGTATMTLKNVSVSDVAQAAFYLRSDAVLENIQVADVGTAGVYIGNGSAVDIKKLTVDRAAGRGLWNFGGTVTASDVILNDSGEFGVTSTYFDGKNGSVTIDNLVINGTTKDNAISANNSTITVTNGQINNAGLNAAIAMFGGKVTLTDVQIKDQTHYGAVASDPGSVVTLNNVSFSGGKRGIVSYHGTIYGKDITIDNTSEFSVTSSYEDSIVNLENVNIRDCQGNAAVNVGGTKTKLTNVLISNPAKNGIDVNQNGTLNMAGVTVDNPGGVGINIIGANVLGDNVRIYNAGNYAIYAQKEGNVVGSTKITNLKVDKTVNQAVSCNATVMTLKDVQIENAGKAGEPKCGVYVIKGGKLTLTNAMITNTAYTSVYVENDGASAYLEDIEIYGGQRGIVCYHGRVEGKNVVIQDTTSFSITSSHSDSIINLTNVKIQNCKNDSGAAVNVGGATVTLKDVTVNGAAGHGMAVDGNGQLNLENATIENVSKWCGIYANGGKVTGSNVTVNNPNYNGVEVLNDGLVNINGLTVNGAKHNGVLVTKGTFEGKNTSIQDVAWHGIHVSANGIAKVNGAQINNSALNGIFVEGGKITGKAISVNSKAHGLAASGGTVELTELKVVNADRIGANIYNKATVKLSDLEIQKAGTHGINVETGSAVELQGAKIQNIGTYNGVYVNGGTVTGKNVTITSPKYNGMEVLNNGNVTLDGLTVSGAPRNGALVTKGIADLKNVNISGCSWHGIHVSAGGELKIEDAKFSAITLNPIFADGGKVTGKNVESTGGHHGFAVSNGSVSLTGLKIHTPGHLGVSAYGSSVLELTDVRIDGTPEQAVKVYESANVTIRGLTIDNCKSGNAAIYVAATADISDASINNPTGHGVDVQKNGNLKLSDSTFTGAKLNGLFVAGGTLTGSNVTVNSPSYSGLAADSGSVNITGLTVNNAGTNGMKLYNSAKVSVKDLTVTNTVKEHGAYVLGNATLTLDGANITGTKLNPLFAEGGTINGNNVSVTSAAHGLAVSGGKVDLTGFTITQAASQGINIYNKSTVKLTDLTIGKAGVHGINVEAGSTVELNKASISNITSYNGIYANGGTVTGTDVTITAPKYNGIEVLNGGSVTLDGLTVSGAPRNGVLVTKGIADLKNVNISGCSYHGVHVPAGGELKIQGAVFSGITLNPIFVDGGIVTGSDIESSGGYHGLSASNGSATITGLKIQTPAHLGITAYGNSVLNLTDAEIIGTAEQAVKVYEKANVTIDGLKIDNCKSGNAAIYVAATADISNAAITNFNGHGVDVEKGGNLKLSDSTVTGAKLNGLFVAGGTLTGGNITVNTPAYAGLAADAGTVNLNGLTVTNAGTNGFKLYNSANVTVSNLTVTNTAKEHGAYVLGNASLTINTGNITGTNLNGIFAEGGTISGSNVTISAKAHGLAVSGGKADISKLTINATGTTRMAVNAYGKSTVKLTDLTVNYAGFHGINVETGAVVDIQGATIQNVASYNGIYANGGTVTGKNVTVNSPKYNGVEVLNGGNLTLDGLTVATASRNGVLVTKGTANLMNINLDGNKLNGINVKAEGVLTVDGGTIVNTTDFAIFLEGGNASSVKNLTIQGGKRGIQVNTGSFTGSEIVIRLVANYGMSANGTIQLTGLEIYNAGNHAINFNSKAVATLSDFLIDTTGWEAIGIYDTANVTLTDGRIINWKAAAIKTAATASCTQTNIKTS